MRLDLLPVISIILVPGLFFPIPFIVAALSLLLFFYFHGRYVNLPFQSPWLMAAPTHMRNRKLKYLICMGFNCSFRKYLQINSFLWWARCFFLFHLELHGLGASRGVKQGADVKGVPEANNFRPATRDKFVAFHLRNASKQIYTTIAVALYETG